MYHFINQYTTKYYYFYEEIASDDVITFTWSIYIKFVHSVVHVIVIHQSDIKTFWSIATANIQILINPLSMCCYYSS